MNDPLHHIEQTLRAHDRKVTRRGDTLHAQCPAHDDRNPSLTVARGTTQPVVITCHAGCDTGQILDALGLTWADISTPTQPATPTDPTRYTYTDRDGHPTYRVNRTTNKRFWQQHLDPATGEWDNGRGPHQPTLYRLPEVLDGIARGDRIVIVEGEKDVHTLTRHGVVATCNLGGAGKFTDDMADLLTGAAQVTVIADNDPAGRTHAHHIGQLLAARNIPHTLHLPTIGNDITEQVGHGTNWDRLQPLPTDTEPSDDWDDLPQPVDWSTLGETTDDTWLVTGLWLEGRAVALYSPSKQGKSLLTLWIAAHLATGRDPFTQHPRPPVTVVYLDWEMTPSDLIARIDEMGLERSTLGNLRYYQYPTLPPLDTPQGGQQLARLVQRDRATVVIMDTVSRAIEGEENSADTIRRYYRHTALQLKQAGVSILRLDHAGKSKELGQRGSSAKRDDVDHVWELTKQQHGVTLRCTADRTGKLPENIALRITNDPLAYQSTHRLLPDGTEEKVTQLDRLGVPIDASRRHARQLITDAGESPGRNDVLGAALTLRKSRDPFGTTDGDHPKPPHGTNERDHTTNRCESTPDHTGDHSGPSTEGSGTGPRDLSRAVSHPTDPDSLI